jgi:glucan phosphoethanolaminetransferase (alkaline phosphatase superfamily)
MSRVDRFRLIALATMYGSPPTIMAVWACSHEPLPTALTIVLTGVLLACLFAAATRVWRYFFLVQFPLASLGLGFAAYTIQFNIPPGETLAQIVAGVSLEEIRGFLGMTPGYWVAIATAGWTVFYIGIALTLSRLQIFNAASKLPTRVLIIFTLAGAVYCITEPVQMAEGVALNPTVGAVLFVANGVPRARAELRGSNVNKIPYAAHGSSQEEVHILVIGESVRRQSWSAYGYGRATTPYLDQIKTEVILFQRAVADANLTNWSVPIIMTGISPEEFALTRVRGNLIDLAREGGYATAWLANQDLNISRSIGIDPDLFVLPPDPEANIFGRALLDGSVLPSFEHEMSRSGRARFIVIHMMGSHWEYFRRYSPAFQRFGSREKLALLSSGSLFLRGPANQSALVDAYDNATLYSDWFLKQLIDDARELNVPASLMFFPDHGEDLQALDGTTGHGLPTYSRHAFEVPAFIWINEAFRKAHPAMVAALQGNAASEIRSHNVFDTEAEIMGISWPDADAKRSFASQKFVPDSSMKVAAGGVLVTPH